MKKFCLFFLIILVGCSNKKVADNQVSKTLVTITSVKMGVLNDSIVLTATSAYMDKSSITAPIASFIKKVYIHQGSLVRPGQLLFTVESKEARALNDFAAKGMGIIKIRASKGGFVNSMVQQEGDYVTEGTVLCTIANRNSLVFQINVPYEYTEVVKRQKTCWVVLPDREVLRASIGRALISMNVQSQSQQYLAHIVGGGTLPEGLIAKAIIPKQNKDSQRQIILKGALQSDENMQNYWVMELLNDSVAVKIPVKIGNSNSQWIEILSPVISPSERIVLDGSYGLTDHALVQIAK